MNIEPGLIEVLKEVLHIDVVKTNEDEKFINMDVWDSMTFMFFIMALENKFNITLSNEEILEMDCITKTKEILNRKF